MTHAGFIYGAYALALGVPLVMAAMAMQRLAAARRRLAALDPRAR